MTTIAAEVRSAFKGKTRLTKAELSEYFRKRNRTVTDDDIRKRISRLKTSGLLISVRQGVYNMSDKPGYVHPDDNFVQKLARTFSSQYPEIKYCVWSSAWLHNFTIHQPAHYFYIFETENDMVETAFNLFRGSGINAYLNPDEATMQLYVMGQKNAVVVKSLTTRSPLIKRKNAALPSLEKMLVDAFTDKKLFYFIQGQELQNILRFSYERFSISFSKLLNYASRRGMKEAILGYYKNNMKQIKTEILND